VAFSFCFSYLYKMPPAQSAPFSHLRKIPFTIATVLINILLFLVTWLVAGSLTGSNWNITLLRLGAQFAPLTLDMQWHRVITHLFLHGSWVQLVISMYTLLYAGSVLEPKIGSKKLAFVYFVCAIGAAIASLYLSLFTIGVGTSGVISGLLGFYLVYNIFFPRKTGKSMVILLIHFTLFTVVHLLLPDQMYADYPAMFGGVIAGIVVGFFSFYAGRRSVLTSIKAEYLMIVLFTILFLLLPGYQVRYFKFFQQVVAAEDTTRYLLKDKLTDDDMRIFIRNYHHWDEILARLNNQPSLPADLAADTFKLRKYIGLRKQENLLKKLVVQREAYAYLDSIDRLQQVMRKYMDLDYGLWSRIKPDAPVDSTLLAKMVTVRYDSTGRETANGRAVYYRIGLKDSLGRWNGSVREYDAGDHLRFKGTFKASRRDGVFLFYAANGSCREAGRFMDGRKFGKWQTFYGNGKVASEVFYNAGYFVSSIWDSLGNQLVVDGNGREIQVYPDDVVKVDGEYRHGVKHGTWYGRYPNGEMHFEETYNQGVLVAGKSRTQDDKTFLYDESSLYPLPEGGAANFQEYLRQEVKRFNSEDLGHVKLSFRVTSNGSIADLLIDQAASPVLDAKAKEILLKGPRWLPARRHGHEKVDEWASVQVEFY
jgi:membrane associated rhomboid family serine protease/antitoxin component YwqK of YwqJK toxin-antitoxin module